MTDHKPLCLTIRDVAAELQLSENQVRLLVKDGRIPSRRIGRAIRILRSDLLEYLEARVELEELRKAETHQRAQSKHEGEPDPNAESLARFADRWRLNAMKRS